MVFLKNARRKNLRLPKHAKRAGPPTGARVHFLIMGSAFFLMEEKEKAKAIWRKVLEIDPTNKVVPQFLKQLE